MFTLISSSTSGKRRSPGWHLAFAILTFSFLLFVTVGLWFTEWISSRRYYTRPSNVLDTFLSPETIDSLYDDVRLHHVLISLTDAVAKTSADWGDAYGPESLEGLRNNLAQEAAKLKSIEPPKKKRRGLFDGGMSVSKQQTNGGLLRAMSKSLGGVKSGNETDDLGSAFLGSLKASAADGFAIPAFFLGIGLAMGTGNSFNLTTMAQSQAQATKVAASLGEQPTGLNLVAQNLGSGFTSQIAPSLGNTTSSLPVGMVAFGLAQGIGQGTAMGLNLTEMEFVPSNKTDAMAIASNFGLGIAGPIAENIALSNLFSGVGSNQMFPMIAAAAGEGIGEGVSKGLGLMKPNMTAGKPFKKRQLAAPGADPSAMNLPNTIGNFTLGLTQSFLQSADLGKVLNPSGMNMSSLGINLDATSLVSISSGAGKGVGEGFAVGLNIIAAVNGTLTSPRTDVNGINATQEQASELFVKNLLAGFLQNGGAQVVGGVIGQQFSGVGKGIDMGKAAEGAARGLAEGTVSALSQGGGLNKVLAGDFPKDLPMKLQSLPPTLFNDSTGGAVVGFMRGLSGEGILLALQQVNAGKNASAGMGGSPFKRNAGADGVTGVAPYPLRRRQDQAAPSSAPTLAIDSNTLQGIAQLSISAATCDGIGGLAALGLGIMNSPTLKAAAAASMNKTQGDNMTTPPLDPSVMFALPKDPITITNEGNNFVIALSDGTIKVNDMAVVPFAIMTAVHIVLTTLAFFYFLPIYVALGAIQRISVMIGHPVDERKNKKWRTVFLGLFAPTALVGIILGMVAMGKSMHFGTGHGILGLISLLFLIPTVVTSLMRLRSTSPTPPSSAFKPNVKGVLSLFKGPSKIHLIAAIFVQISLALGMLAWIQGFSVLRSISLCAVDAVLKAPAVVGLMNIVSFTQVGATALIVVRQYLESLIAKREAEEEKNGGMKMTDDDV